MLKCTTKSLILSLFVLFLSLTTTANNANANMFNKFKNGFYFEKYKTAEEAKAALLELHPIGSDVEGVVRTLTGAGAVNRTIESKFLFLDKRKIENGYLVWYWYSHNKLLSIFPRKWDVFIEKTDSKIINIFVSYQQGE